MLPSIVYGYSLTVTMLVSIIHGSLLLFLLLHGAEDLYVYFALKQHMNEVYRHYYIIMDKHILVKAVIKVKAKQASFIRP
jgi:hypothetical protein